MIKCDRVSYAGCGSDRNKATSKAGCAGRPGLIKSMVCLKRLVHAVFTRESYTDS